MAKELTEKQSRLLTEIITEEVGSQLQDFIEYGEGEEGILEILETGATIFGSLPLITSQYWNEYSIKIKDAIEEVKLEKGMN